MHNIYNKKYLKSPYLHGLTLLSKPLNIHSLKNLPCSAVNTAQGRLNINYQNKV